MNTTRASLGQITDSSKRVGARLLAIAENRLELLTVEMQEERDRLLLALLLALGLAVLGLLAGIALSAAVVVLFWAQSPLGVLLGLTALYTLGGIAVFAKLQGLFRDWETLPATLAQLKKDRTCVEQMLE
jgi:uncharacterized membrane protein YqjE